MSFKVLKAVCEIEERIKNMNKAENSGVYERLFKTGRD